MLILFITAKAKCDIWGDSSDVRSRKIVKQSRLASLWRCCAGSQTSDSVLLQRSLSYQPSPFVQFTAKRRNSWLVLRWRRSILNPPQGNVARNSEFWSCPLFDIRLNYHRNLYQNGRRELASLDWHSFSIFGKTSEIAILWVSRTAHVPMGVSSALALRGRQGNMETEWD